MSYTKIAKPTTPTYTDVIQPDPLDNTFEWSDGNIAEWSDGNVFLWKPETTIYTGVSKPSAPTYTEITKPTF